MNIKKIRLTIIIGTILVFSALIITVPVSAAYHRVSGYLYIDSEIASEGVLVTLSFYNKDFEDHTNENGHYQIDFTGYEGETGYFTVTYNTVDYIPTPNYVDIEEDPAYNINLSIDTSPPENNPPYAPSNPDPYNGEIDVYINTDFSWIGGDPDGDNVTYDVHFGTTSPPQKVVSNQTGTSYDPPGVLDFSTEYYWQIVAWDEYEYSTVGFIWSFTTEANSPPNTPSNPNPSDGKTDVNTNADLSWTGGDPNPGDTVKYDVYFGTNSTPPLVTTGQSGTSYDPGTMAVDTYYWKIIAKDKNGASTEGPIWSFKTSKSSPPPPPPGDDNNPPKADASASETTGIIGIPVNFDGSLSSDSDGTITGYKWDFNGDGIYDIDWSINAKSTYTYNSTGLYIVKLQVKDNEGKTDTDEIRVTISAPANNPPTAPLLSGPTDGKKNTDYAFTAVSTDPDGDEIRYIFYWADGSTNTETEFVISNKEVVMIHNWTSAGVYPILVYAEDSNGSFSGISKKLIFIDIDYELLDDGTYLLDTDRDGSWDQIYNPETGESEDYLPDDKPSPSNDSKEESKEEDALWSYLIGLTLIIIILLVILIFYTKMQEGKKSVEPKMQEGRKSKKSKMQEGRKSKKSKMQDGKKSKK